jgi:hypothetical protein
VIQIVVTRVACGGACEGASGNYRITAEVITGTTEQHHVLGGSGVDYDTSGGPVDLPESDWTFEEPTRTSIWAGFPVRLIVRAQALPSGETHGMRVTIRTPAQRQWEMSVGPIVVTCQMRVPIHMSTGGFRFGYHNPEQVFMFRTDSDEYQTVSMEMRNIRLEINPVYPYTIDLPAHARPPWTALSTGAHTEPSTTTSVVNAGTVFANAVTNPSVIPRIDNPQTTTSAIIRVTQYWPSSLALTFSDSRLRWRWTTVDGGGAIRFVGAESTRDRGFRVQVAGESDGEVQLQLYYYDHQIATYRALVRPIVKLPYRANILIADGAAPLVTAASIVRDIERTNVVLRQVALELVPDTSGPAHTNATETSPGVFTVTVPQSDTLQVDSGTINRVAATNARRNVVNYTFVRSKRPGMTVNARAVLFPGSTHSAGQLTDTGVPSVSWLEHTGTAGDTASSTITMRLFPEHGSSRGDSGGPLVAITLVADNGYVNGTLGWRAHILAHELGHCLNLLHRTPDADGLPGPRMANQMRPNTSAQAHDFDLLQAKAIWLSHLVQHYRAHPLP